MLGRRLLSRISGGVICAAAASSRRPGPETGEGPGDSGPFSVRVTLRASRRWPGGGLPPESLLAVAAGDEQIDDPVHLEGDRLQHVEHRQLNQRRPLAALGLGQPAEVVDLLDQGHAATSSRRWQAQPQGWPWVGVALMILPGHSPWRWDSHSAVAVIAWPAAARSAGATYGVRFDMALVLLGFGARPPACSQQVRGHFLSWSYCTATPLCCQGEPCTLGV